MVHIERFRDGARRIANVTEVLGMEGDVITMQDVFKYDYKADAIMATGIRPQFTDRLRRRGHHAAGGGVRPMIVICRLSPSSWRLFLLFYMALPGPAGQPSNAWASSGSALNLGPVRRCSFLERTEASARLAQALSLADVKVEPGQFVLRIAVVSLLLAIVGLLSVARPGPGRCCSCRTSSARILGVHKGRQAYGGLRGPVARCSSARWSCPCGPASACRQAMEAAGPRGSGAASAVRSSGCRPRSAWVASLSEAMRSLSERMDNADLEWVVGAIDINRETGGNLSDILATVNDTIRDRQRIQRKVNTFTAEGRMSAKILTVGCRSCSVLAVARTPRTASTLLFHGTRLPRASRWLRGTHDRGLVLDPARRHHQDLRTPHDHLLRRRHRRRHPLSVVGSHGPAIGGEGQPPGRSGPAGPEKSSYECDP